MISRSVRLLEARSTIFPDRQQAIGEATVSFSAYPIQALTNRFRDCRSHGLAGESRQFFHDLSGNLIVQLGSVTEDLNRRWYELNSGQVITDVQRHVKHPALKWMTATLNGRVEASGAVFEAKFMLPWSFSEEAAAEKYMPQL